MKFLDRKMKWLERWILLGLIGVTAVALLAPFSLPWPQLLAFLLLFVWPVFSWSRCLAGDDAERVVLSVALVMALNMLLVLLLAYWPGAMVRPYQLIVHTLLAALPLIINRKTEPIVREKSIWLPVLLLILLVVGLRVANLGYSEFQGDEGVIMVRAAAIITGDDAEIFLHQKGPVEILLPLGLWNLAGSMNEFWARLPFAWAGIWAVLAVALLARRWFDRPTGIIAGTLLAIVGFAVAFSRIVQYQSLVMLWGALAVLAAVRYAADGRRVDLWLTAVFLGTGLLAHYDAVLVVPAVGWILLKHLWQTKRFDWQAWGSAFVSGAIILAIFYIPYVLNPNVGQTGRYLIQGRLGAGNGQGLLSWSGPEVWQMVTFYNSLYFVAGLIGLLLLGVWVLWRRKVGETAVLFFVVPFLFYLFIVADPRTHVYTFFPGAVILAAVGVVYLWQKSDTRPIRYALLGGLALFWLVSANYVYLLFVDNTPERQRNWVAERPSNYPTTWDELPLYGLFGFPHQAGWRAVRPLLNAADYPYASNEEREVTTWYMAQSPRTHCPNFATFILTENAQDEIPYDPVWLDEMVLQYEVTVNGRTSLWVYGTEPVTAVQTIETSPEKQWLTPREAAPPSANPANKLNVVLGDNQVRLLGYDLDLAHAHSGGQIVVTLYWQALAPFDQNYQAFVHLFDGELRAQHDGAPECAFNPTTRWEPGQIITDPHIIPLLTDVPDIETSLLVGMYNLVTGERLTVPGTSDNVVRLGDTP
jgi:hypothetical protein